MEHALLNVLSCKHYQFLLLIIYPEYAKLGTRVLLLLPLPFSLLKWFWLQCPIHALKKVPEIFKNLKMQFEKLKPSATKLKVWPNIKYNKNTT